MHHLLTVYIKCVLQKLEEEQRSEEILPFHKKGINVIWYSVQQQSVYVDSNSIGDCMRHCNIGRRLLIKIHTKCQLPL